MSIFRENAKDLSEPRPSAEPPEHRLLLGTGQSFGNPQTDPPSTGLRELFQDRTDSAFQSAIIETERQLRMGNIEADQVSTRISGAELTIAAQQRQQEESKNSSDNLMFMALIDTLQEQLAELEALRVEADTLWDGFVSKYGGIEAAADALLTPDERKGCETEEEIKKAMVKKYLNDDGTPKDGAMKILGPDGVKALQAYKKVLDKEAEVKNEVETYIANGSTPEGREEVKKMLDKYDIADTADAARSSRGLEAEKTITELNDEVEPLKGGGYGLGTF